MMISRLWTAFLLSLACASTIAWLVALMHEKNIRPVQDLVTFFKKQSKVGRVLLGTFFIAMWVIASTKPGNGGGNGGSDGGGDGGGTNNVQMVIGPGGGLQPLDSPGAVTNDQQQGFQGGIQPPQGGMVGDPAPATDEWTDFTPITSTNTTRTLDGDDFRRGFVMYRIGTDEEFDFSAPPGATVCTDWRSFGAASDWIYVAFTNWVFQVGTNEIDHLRLFSFGKVDPLVRDAEGHIATNSWFAPFMASLGVVPEANWDLLAENDRPSQLWHCITLQGSLVVTWQNALLGRDAETPLSFQAEFFPNGRFTYRYDLSRLNVETVSNILAGASFGGNEWTTNALPTNVTSMAFYPLSEEDVADQDRDCDGLPLLDELFAFGTDPDFWDTDCDGVSDGDEVAAGTNPRSRDSDGDGLVDGSDPDPAVQTSLADLDGDGIPDAYEDYWFGGTNAFNTATNRDDTGFTLDTKILGGINPTNQVAAANVVSTNGLVSWKLFDAFAADWPANATNLVWERTFTVGRSSAWQQFFVSASPTNAAAWSLRGAVLEWETDTGVSGTAAASPGGDSFRIPLSAEDFPYELTLRLRAAGGVTVYSPSPLHLIAYAPEFRIDGGNEMTGDSGAKFSVFTDGSDSQISLVIDHSLRPCNATPGCDEGDMTEFENLSMTGSDFSFAGDSSGGTIYASRPGIYTLPDYSLGVSFSVPLRSPRRSGRRGGGHTIIVLDPSVSWNCSGHGCGYDGLGYDWYGDSYYEEEYYPLDSKCLRKKWYHDWGGGWNHDSCELSVSSGLGDDGYVTTSTDGGTGRVYVDGVEVWSGSAEHTYDDTGCGGGGGYDDDYLGGECDSCDEDCANGNCDSLEGPSLGSLKFRIPLGAPVKGQVAGFVWFSTDGPISVSRSTFQLLRHPDADVYDYVSSGARRIVCHDSRGRDLRIENIANGVRITIYETDAQTLEHTWEIVNVNGNASQVRLKKISRLNNVMSDETYTYAEGDWTLFDNIAGVGTQLTTYNDFADYGDGMKSETRTTTDAAGNVLSSVTVQKSRIGECDNAVIRETYREESTGLGWKWSQADYWNDPAHSGRHGQPRLVWGNARAWKYMDYDENGHETLLVEQRGGAPIPSGSPYVISNELYNASVLADTFVTVRDFTPLPGDSGHQDDAARPRIETRYVVTNGVAAIVGRTWTRYTRLNRDGYAAIKAETWRAGAQGASAGDAGNAYSYKITYADTGVGTPLLMRNAAAETLDENGVLTVNAYSLSDGVLSQTSRRFFQSQEFPTYETVELDASYGTVLRRTTRLTDGNTIIADEQSIYDSQNRLRSTTYLDGTSLTNAYSCCRLLWKRDREGRKTLRSAVTGTDHLYNAMEDVWLAGVSTNGLYRVTQHFYDALGRETNTVVYVGTTPGEATEAAASDGKAYTTVTTYYPYGGSDYAVSTDERGKVTIRRIDILGDCVETGEAVFTNGVEVVKTKSRSYFGGGMSTRREWGGDKFTEERRFEDYATDGCRIEYVVTESHDCGVVTNSVSTYDLLGRLVSSTVHGANGSTIVTVNAYDGTTARILSAATTGSPVVTYGYNERGERASTSQDGTTILNDASYETISQQIYRVATSVRMTGNVTNSVQIRKVQLTGLSDSLRSRTVSVAASGRETVTETAFDAATGILTSVSQTEASTPVTARSIYGVTFDQTSIDGASEMSYDALGRNVAVAASDASGATNRVDSLEYDQSGNVVRRVTDFRDGRVAEATAEYDMPNREVRRTDALGNETVTGYDPLGRTVSTSGDAYPILSGFDSAGRKTHGFTTRNSGATWDETQWEFDPASGVNTAKEYADGSRVAYSYTDNGKKTRTTWARGVWKQHVYNVRNLVSGTTYSGTATPSVAYTYADSGKTASATLSDGTSYAYGYDDRLLNTNESITVVGEAFSVNRTFDGFRRAQETAVVVTNVQHSAKVRLYDSEDRVCGYALTNAAGRGVSVSLAYDGSYVTNTVYTLPNGSIFSARLSREAGRRNLVTRRDYFFGGQSIYWYSTEYDLLNRPTNATDSVSLVREWLYNRRSELAAATVGADSYGYAYDSIGNRLWSAANAVTNSYTANSLNQYTAVSSGANPVYDADGNMTGDGTFAYAYDAENRLVSVTSAAETNGAIRVLNAYDHRNRRIRKTVQRLNSSIAPPPSPPVGIHEWETQETHTFVWDGNNIVLEKVEFANGTPRTFEYFWGADKSGTEQGAGGVEGLLAVSMDGVFYIPCYDHNGNIILYVSETGSIAAQYTYDPYGNIIDFSGSLANVFSFGFSTQYHDRETGMVGYKRRFYRPDLGRWLNRDPIEEEGGENLYAFCRNSPQLYVDVNGNFLLIDSLVLSAVGGIVGGVSAALSGGDVVAGIAGGAISGLCLSICPAAAGGCGALGGAVSGFISGIRSANSKKLCGARWSVHVAGSVVVETASGALFGKAGAALGDGLQTIAGSWTRTTTTSSLSLSIEVVGTDFASSLSCGVSSTAAETVMDAVETGVGEIFRMGEEQERLIEQIDVELDASGTFK